MLLYDSEDWSVIFYDEARFSIFINQVPKKLYGPERDTKNGWGGVVYTIPRENL